MKNKTKNILKGVGITALGAAGTYIFGNNIYTAIENIQQYDAIKEFVDIEKTSYMISQGLRIGAGIAGVIPSASLPIYWIKSRLNKENSKLENLALNQESDERR